LKPVSNVFWDWTSGHLVGPRIEPTANRGDSAYRQDRAVAPYDMPVRDARITKPLDRQIDAELVFKESRSFVIARAMNAWPRDGQRLRRSTCASAGKNRPATAPKQRVLGLLHVEKKRREVCDSSRVGFRKLDAPLPSKYR
jgi:hypothetical protein